MDCFSKAEQRMYKIVGALKSETMSRVCTTAKFIISREHSHPSIPDEIPVNAWHNYKVVKLEINYTSFALQAEMHLTLSRRKG